MHAAQTHNPILDRLAPQIASLQEIFRTLSSATNARDLAARFVTSIGTAFPGVTITLLASPSVGGAWSHIAGAPADREPVNIVFPGDREKVSSTLDSTSTMLHVVQRLVDNSFVSLQLKLADGAAAFSEADTVSARLFAHLYDNAYQALLSRRTEKDLIFSLNHRVLQLNSLIDTGIEVTKLDAAITPEYLALQRAASLTNAAAGSVSVKEGTGEVRHFAFPEGGRVPQATHRITSEFGFAGRTYAFELFDKESRSGIRPFDETDQLLLDALTRQVHASLENRYLHAQALEKQKIEQDIQVAAAIQQRILPAELPTIAGYDISGINIPSKSVGGDYYDCIPLPDGRYALVIADVAGKGVPAALLVSSLHAYLSAYLEGTIPLNELARRLNKVISRASTDDKFITAHFSVLSPETGELESVNAGHNPPYLLRLDGTIRELSTGGIALGMLDVDLPFESESVRLEHGERLLLYTDGIPEATNENHEMFEAEVPLQRFFLTHTPDQASVFIRELIASIKSFTGNAPQSDDITALYLLRR